MDWNRDPGIVPGPSGMSWLSQHAQAASPKGIGAPEALLQTYVTQDAIYAQLVYSMQEPLIIEQFPDGSKTIVGAYCELE